MRNILFVTFLLFSIIANGQKYFNADGLKIGIDNKGKITTFFGDKEYLPKNANSYIVRARINGVDEVPESVKWKGSTAEVRFSNKVKVSVKGIERLKHLRFEVVDVGNIEKLDILYWGPFENTISETIGEYVGVVRNRTYALGFQSLNVRTTGGKIFNSDGSDQERGTVATAEDDGSSL